MQNEHSNIMELKIDIPEYDENRGFQFNWVDGFEIESSYDNGVINITANKEGLISLANHLLNLAQDSIPNGYHLHFDEHNSLEEKSIEIIVQKK